MFSERSRKLTAALEAVLGRRAETETLRKRLEAGRDSRDGLIPRTEKLLESYELMTCHERNVLLKAILRRIEYEKGADGKIVIDLYPRLPRI